MKKDKEIYNKNKLYNEFLGNFMKSPIFFMLAFYFILIGIAPLKAQNFQVDFNPTRQITDSTNVLSFRNESPNTDIDYSDSRTGIIRTIPVSRNPMYVVISKDNLYAFIGCPLSNMVEIINIATGQVVKSFPVKRPSHLTLNNDGTKLLVSSLIDSLADASHFPNDCQLITTFTPVGHTLLTIIDIASLEIEQVQTIDIPFIRNIFNSDHNDTIYLRSDAEILKYNYKNSTIAKRWEFDYQIYKTVLDIKNNRIFISSFTDSLRALLLPNGPVISVPYNNTGQNNSSVILLDTASNRIFTSGFNDDGVSIIHVFNALTLEQYSPIACDFRLLNMVVVPSTNSLFLSGFGNNILELDYTTLIKRREIDTWITWQLLYNVKNHCLYSFQNGNGNWSPPSQLDIIEYDLMFDFMLKYQVSTAEYGCCYERSMSLTPDGRALVITNSADNSVSIMNFDNLYGINSGENLKGYFLSQNFPNPVTSTTTISYGIPFNSDVKLSILDKLGQEIFVMVNGRKPAGNHTISFDGNQIPPGLYFYKMETNDFISTRKFINL